jgi:hypothetical protein
VKILEEEPPLEAECKLPWLINAFLYSTSASGLIHVAVFVVLPRIVSFIIGLLGAFLQPWLRHGTGYIILLLTLPFYLVFYGYMFYYITYRVIDSAKGNRRASDIPISETFGAGDFLSQAILLLGCIAICYWPAAIYYLVTRQTDERFWLLTAGGTFFLPMSFLRGVMFDSFDALNPMQFIQSIYRTFFSYCGLVLFFLVVGGFIAIVLPRVPLWGFVSAAIKIYLVFVLAHRLGWFYWWHKDKLDWGI